MDDAGAAIENRMETTEPPAQKSTMLRIETHSASLEDAGDMAKFVELREMGGAVEELEEDGKIVMFIGASIGTGNC
jgi:hypothetical protein